MVKLIVALGNPGLEYELNRHNVGWLVVDTNSELSSKNWKQKFKGIFTDLNIGGHKIYFLKPQTYMNLSGESVRAMCDFFKIKLNEMIVLHDELDLPLGQIQFKQGGGLAGHNGLKSISSCMGGQDFYRMRIGIGRPVHGSVSSWVLSNFSQEQDIDLGIVLENSNKALEVFIKQGFKKASNEYNKKNFLN